MAQSLDSFCPGLSCNFETELCGWYQDNSDNFDWMELDGMDHTIGIGELVRHKTHTHPSHPRWNVLCGVNNPLEVFFLPTLIGAITILRFLLTLALPIISVYVCRREYCWINCKLLSRTLDRFLNITRFKISFQVSIVKFAIQVFVL